MKSTFTTKTISVYGQKWAKQTESFLKTVGLTGSHLSVFNYEHREILFMEQYDVFIITDFEQDQSSFSVDYQRNLDILRQVVYTRSMRSVIFANANDPDVYKSLREAGARVIEVRPFNQKNIPISFANAILREFFAEDRISVGDSDLIELVA